MIKSNPYILPQKTLIVQLFIIVISILIVLPACSNKHIATLPAYQFTASAGQPDYSRLDYWAAHPYKWDPSDSIPKKLRKTYRKDSTVDVFFVHPTSMVNQNDPRWNAPIDDAFLNRRTDYSSILYQASAFSEPCRVFAPRYRQANLKVFFTSNKVKADSALALAYTDVRAAFLYYLQNYNNGRPFIIAAHSQGTLHAARLLKEFVEGKPPEQKLVAAYLVGMPLPDTLFTSLPACKDSLSTGCFLGWRTYKRGFIDPLFVAKEQFRSIVTNPLLWNSSEAYAPKRYNKGAVLTNFKKPRPANVDAQVFKNVLWTSKPKFIGNIFLRKKNYHVADINLFYRDITANVKTRIRMYWKGQ